MKTAGLVLAAALAARAAAAELPDNCKAFTCETMPYRLLIPRDYDPQRTYPLVLCLHGAHARGTNNVAGGSEAAAFLMTDEQQAQHPCFLLAPQCPRGKRWVDVPWRNGSYDTGQIPVTGELTLALKILDTVVRGYAIDTNRLYLAGQSMGGYGAWDALVRRPGTFAAAIVNCGAGDPRKADLLKDVPVWVFHGDQDPIVPVAGAREIVEAIRKAGGTLIRYTELPGAGHYPRIMATPGLVDWLFGQRR